MQKGKDVVLGENLAIHFWARVSLDEETGCWLWTGKRNKKGYGKTTHEHTTQYQAHRVAYCLCYKVVNLPDGLELDHICRNRSCVNPTHLEPVTSRTNIVRGLAPSILAERSRSRCASRTHCSYGHEYTPENTYVYISKGYTVRRCKICQRRRNEIWFEKSWTQYYAQNRDEILKKHRTHYAENKGK